MGVGPSPVRTTSIPPPVSPSTSAASSAGELSLPSRPTATRLPPFSARTAAKARPSARASPSPSVSPTIPRTSYSRRMVGLNTWPRPAPPSRMASLLTASAIFAEDLLDRLAHIRARQGEGDVGLQESHLVAAVKAPTVEAQAVEWLVAAHELRQRIGELDLVAGAAADTGEMLEHLGLQDIAADDAQIRGRLGGRRLLHHAAHLDETAVILLDVEDAIAVCMLARHFHDRDDVAVGLLVHVDHLRQARLVRKDEVIGKQHGKGLVAHQVARAPHRVTEAERHLLARIGDLARTRHPRVHSDYLGVLAALLERGLELVGMVEMILDRRLGASGDENEFLDSSGLRLLDRVLDQRLVDDRQHLLRHRLGGRKESRTQASDREDGLANWLCHEHRSLSVAAVRR